MGIGVYVFLNVASFCAYKSIPEPYDRKFSPNEILNVPSGVNPVLQHCTEFIKLLVVLHCTYEFYFSMYTALKFMNYFIASEIFLCASNSVVRQQERNKKQLKRS